VLSPAFRYRILQLTESGYPLIFNALDYMGKAFGFVCYYFRDYFISNYSNTVNATNAIGTAIGGYVNIQYQRTLLEKMDEMYRHDPLTGLFNRIGFHNQFKKICKKHKYDNKEITVIMSDLDGLKYINDHFGHADGDNAIATTAKALMDSVPENSLSARFGGDEIFSVIFGECDPDQIIKNIDKYLDKYNEGSGKPYDVSTSCGYITTILNDDFDITKAVKNADTSMYEVKREKYIRKGIITE
jgi:diguanylate cyclase (GGDEF)-like protein